MELKPLFRKNKKGAFEATSQMIGGVIYIVLLLVVASILFTNLKSTQAVNSAAYNMSEHAEITMINAGSMLRTVGIMIGIGILVIAIWSFMPYLQSFGGGGGGAPRV